jgi:protein SCO1/2
MSPHALKRIAILGFLGGVAALLLVVLLGPQLLPIGLQPKHTTVYLSHEFRLLDQNGREFTEKGIRSKPTAWFFGFTNCPDVCPTTLSDLARALDQLGPDADRLNVVFVTVDPERDTPEVLREYLASFDPRIIGLTGSLGDIQAMAKGFFVHQAQVPLTDGGYTMEHYSKVLLTSAGGRFVGTIDHQEPIKAQVQKLQALTREG